MSLKRDTVAQRLRSLAEEEKSRKKTKRIFADFPVGMLDADPILTRARALSEAIYMRSDEIALAKAFQFFDLDHQKPEHWHLLINYLSRSHFETKLPGRPREWTPEKFYQLMLDFRLAGKKTGVKPQSWRRNIPEILIHDPDFGGRYKHMKQDALAKQIDHMFAWINGDQKTKTSPRTRK